MGTIGSPILLPSHGSLFPVLLCLVKLRYDDFYFILFLFLFFFCYLLEVCSFLVRDKQGVVQDEIGVREEMGGLEGGETIIRKYCMKTELGGWVGGAPS